jgi:thiol:disulfide interchange protein
MTIPACCCTTSRPAERALLPPDTRYNRSVPETKSHSSHRAVLIGGVALALIAIAVVARTRTAVEQVPWRTDYTAGMAEAAKGGKPVLLDFSAGWCPPCQSMKRDTWSDAAVAKALEGDVPITVDPDHHLELLRKYDVQAYPTMILLSPAGVPVREQVGYVDAEDFLKWLHSPALP